MPVPTLQTEPDRAESLHPSQAADAAAGPSKFPNCM